METRSKRAIRLLKKCHDATEESERTEHRRPGEPHLKAEKLDEIMDNEEEAYKNAFKELVGREPTTDELEAMLYS